MAGRREIEGDFVMGWADRKRPSAYLSKDAQGRVVRVRTPVADLQGLITPTDLRFVIVQLDAPEPVHPDDWSLSIAGEVERPREIGFEELRAFPASTVRCVTECAGSESDFFDYLKSGGRTHGCYRCPPREGKPSRFDLEEMHTGEVSSGEWTGVPLAVVLKELGVKAGAAGVLAHGFDRGRPGEVATFGARSVPEGEINFEKCLPLEKALHPDTLLAWALNGEYIRHIHGGPVRLVTPGWSGNWSVKWLDRIEVLDHVAPVYYQDQYFYYSQSAEDPNKEMITAMGVRSMITDPRDGPRDGGLTLPRGTHVIRGLAWSGAGRITGVEVSVDGGRTWRDAHVEQPQERWLWVRWSYAWEADSPGKHSIMARATDEAGRAQPQIGWNFLRKGFDGIVPVEVQVE